VLGAALVLTGLSAMPARAVSVVAVPDSGTGVSGIASTPIADVAANDTINGKPALLRSSGDATVAEVGTWAAGITLIPQTGAINIASTLPPGVYSVEYQLCDRQSPPQCDTTTDTITVTPQFMAYPEAGSAIEGNSSIAIGNVAANDIVNGAAATLGKSGNATVASLGIWQSGITLNTFTGAVSVSGIVLTGNYHIQYQLCDTLTPQTCASATDTVTVTAPFTEVQASSEHVYGDIEFDWARDGVYCASCNFGLSNSQVNWTDTSNNLWVNPIDPTTGLFAPSSGQQTLVDTTAFFWKDWGNGPEWAFSTPVAGQNPISQLVYSRYRPGYPASGNYAGAAIATIVSGDSGPTWQLNFFPGAIGPSGNNTVLPEASQCNSDTVPLALFRSVDEDPQTMFTEEVSTTTGTQPTKTPFGAYASGIAERWVPCTHWLTFQGIGSQGEQADIQQVYWYDTDTQVVQQLTSDATTKARAVMFLAPDFPDSQGNAQYALVTEATSSSGQTSIQVYLQHGTRANGAPNFRLINNITSPDPTQPYMFDPKAFINCTPTCQTYVLVGLGHTPNPQQNETSPNGLGVMGINPQSPFFEILAPSLGTPATKRLDPKYFITSRGPAIYYDRILAVSATQPYMAQGIYLINMQLGPPSGNCVGSSAEDGLSANWPNCAP
jgi:hypothetical protein